MTDQPSSPEQTPPSSADRLDSWKEIASYLKRSVRTVHRWEAEQALPVHRHIHQSSGTVYAFKSELDSWWASREADLGQIDPAQEDPVLVPVPPGRRRGPKSWFVAAVIAGMLLLAVGYVRYAQQSRPNLSGKAKVRLLVLPFENLTGEPEQEYVSAGLTTEMINGLGALAPARLLVIARTTATNYKRAGKSIADIHRELRVDYVLEGTVRRSGDRLRVTAQLIDATSSAQVWSNTYDRGSRDLLQLETEIARKIAGEVEVAFDDPNTRSRVPDVNPYAEDAWLRGNYSAAETTADGLEKAIANYEKANALDPTFAAPYTGLAEVYITIAMTDLQPPDEAVKKSEAYALKAIQLDPKAASPHVVLGWVKLDNWDLQGAENEFRIAIDLNPSLADAYVGLGQLAALRRRKSDIDVQFKTAIDLDPASPWVYAVAGFAQNAIGDHKAAERMCNRALELDPASITAQYCLGHTYQLQNQPVRAIALLAKAASKSGIPAVRAALACAYAKSGEIQTARRALNQLQTDYPNVSPFSIALIWESLGEHEEALRWLEKAYKARSIFLLYAGDDGNFDALRSDARFQQLMENVMGNEHP